MDELKERRRAGETFASLSVLLEKRYGVRVSPQGVRAKVTAALGDQETRQLAATFAADRAGRESEDAQLIAEYLDRHPTSSLREIASGTAMPLHRVESLMATARTLVNGYFIPTKKDRAQYFDDEYMLDMLEDVHDAMGLGDDEPLSQAQYHDFRERQSERAKSLMPSSLAYRRRFGSWIDATEKAGLVSNPLPRDYDGLTTEDVEGWLALWLRDLRNANQGLLEANQGSYRAWLESHPEAPSEEFVRLKSGSWHTTVTRAAAIERSGASLPTPKAVSRKGRVKSFAPKNP